MKRFFLFAMFGMLGLLFRGIAAEEPAMPGYYASLEIRNLDVASGIGGNVNLIQWRGENAHVTRVRIEGEGQAYVGYGIEMPRQRWSGMEDGRIAVRVPARREVRGELVLPVRGSGERRIAFTIPADDLNEEADAIFHRTVVLHYQRLLDLGFEGRGWFQAQRDLAAAKLTEMGGDVADGLQFSATFRRGPRAQGIDQTFDLFTGIQAASENLQLDELIRVDADEKWVADISVDSLQGITIEAVDWEELIEDPEPAHDALARYVPSDQFAIFFPDAGAMVKASQNVNRIGSRIVQWADHREDFQTRQRYEVQLGVTLEQLAALADELEVGNIVMTAGDPYLVGGSDVALVLETSEPQALVDRLQALQEDAAVRAGVQLRSERIGGQWEATVVRTEGRTVSSYVAVLGEDAVVLSNSPVQLERVAGTAAGLGKSLAQLDEYTYFRGRYRLGEPETLWLVVSDETIRKLGSPRWRIAASRRVRALAAMQHVRAIHLGDLLDTSKVPGVLDLEMAVPGAGELRLTAEGVMSDVYGRPGFLTPIGEITIDNVTEAEAAAYRRWRSRYQGRWRYEFCPIALRLVFEGERLAGDITVLPLIEGSEYREWINTVGNARIEAPLPMHSPTLAHFSMAVDLDSALFVQPRDMVRMTLSGVENPLGWIGSMFGIYAEDMAFWEELLEAEDPWLMIEEKGAAVPVALYVEVRNPMRLAAFLTGLRGMVQSTAPGMLRWVNREHADRDYVAVVTEPALTRMGVPREVQLLYAMQDGYFLMTLNEDMMKRFLAEKEDPAEPARPWLGRHVNLHIEGTMLRMLERLEDVFMFEDLRHAVGESAWRALPVLNDLRQHFPDRDPMAVYTHYRGSVLREPFGGNYVWNEAEGTMESTQAGHPGSPRTPEGVSGVFDGIDAAAFGLDFSAEHDALRGRFEIDLLPTE